MPTYGRFETVDELSSSGPYSVFTARQVGGDGSVAFAVKKFRTDDDLADPEIVARMSADFLDAARVNQSVNQTGAKRWSKVLETGRGADAAFYVAELAPSTLQRLVDSRRQLDGRILVDLLTAVTDGLIELREATGGGEMGRGHGRLDPTNVLLMDAAPEAAAVALTDPAPSTQVDSNTRLEDIKGIGGILFQLVAHRPPPSGTEIRKGPEWSCMGAQGEALRTLCEQLLNPNAASATPPTLEQIKQRLADVLKLRAASKGVGTPVKIAAGLLIAAGAAGAAWYFLRPPPVQPPKLTGPADTSDPTEKERAEMPGEVAKLRDALVKAKTEFDALGEPGDTAYSSLLEKLGALTRDVEDHTKVKWITLKDYKEAGNVVPDEARELPADLLKTRDEKVIKPHDAIKARIASFSGEVAFAQTSLKLAADLVKAQAEAKSAADLVERGRRKLDKMAQEGKDAFKPIEDKGAALAAAAAKAAADLDAFSKMAPPAADAGRALGESIAKLTADVPALRTSFDEWRRKFDTEGNATQELIKAEGKKQESSKEFASADLRFKISDFLIKAETHYDTPEDFNKDYAKVKSWLKDVQSGVRDVKLSFKPQPGGFVQQDQLDGVAEAAGERAVKRVVADAKFTDGVPDAVASSDPIVARERKVVTDWARDVDALLNQAAQADRMLSGGYDWEEKGDGGASLSALYSTLTGSPTLADLKAKSQEKAGKVEAFGNGRFRELSEAIDAVAERAKGVRDIATGSDAAPALLALITAEAGKPGTSARVMSAWKRLAATDYPGNLKQLDEAAAAYTNVVKPAAEKLTDPVRAAAASKNAAAFIPAMWLELVNKRLGGKPADVEAAFEPKSMERWGVTDATLAGLNPAAKLNRRRLKLLADVRAISGDSNSQKTQLQQKFAEFFADVSQLDPSGAATKSDKYQSFYTKFFPMSQGKFLDLATEGPAGAASKKPWTLAEKRGDNDAGVYASPKGARLEFVRISASEPATYLCTTEVSVAVLAELLEADGIKGETLRELAGMDKNKEISPTDTSDDGRKGPRTWLPTRSGPVPGAPEQDNDSKGWIASRPGGAKRPDGSQMKGAGYDASIDAAVTPPAPTSPVNYVPPAFAEYCASLAGCRLPTSAEWAAAAAREPNASANRRDQSVVKQLAYLDAFQNVQGVWYEAASPLSGILQPEGAKPGADKAPAVQASDGVLWFTHVDDGGGQLFHHLIGNVAEFVCDDPSAWSKSGISGSVPTKKKLDDFAAAAAGNLKVIGASALSPAAIDPAQAQTISKGRVKNAYSDVGFRLAFTTTGVGGDNAAQTTAADLAARDYFAQ
ncbi:MAG: hypothetical protein JSR77_03920 [Planctomycetes bacterium]|nr:hypothetical protein [Planctomycetota bacterium]